MVLLSVGARFSWIFQTNYLRVINAFTQIEAAKAYVFANSEFTGADWDTKFQGTSSGKNRCMASIQRMLGLILDFLMMKMIF